MKKQFTITRTTQTTYEMVVTEEELNGRNLNEYIFDQQDDNWKTFDANAKAEYNDNACRELNAPKMFLVRNPDGERVSWLEIEEEGEYTTNNNFRINIYAQGIVIGKDMEAAKREVFEDFMKEVFILDDDFNFDYEFETYNIKHASEMTFELDNKVFELNPAVYDNLDWDYMHLNQAYDTDDYSFTAILNP